MRKEEKYKKKMFLVGKQSLIFWENNAYLKVQQDLKQKTKAKV